MPEPRRDETHDAWIERCMSSTEARRDFPDQDQRLAFCESTWERMHTNRDVGPRPVTTHLRQTATLRRETFDGEEHVVAPVVAAVEGVLNGSLLTAEEMGRYVQAWNGIPVPVLHPESAGQHVSANSPRVLEESMVGRFFNARMDGPKLKGEVWLNVRRAEQVAPGLIEAMEAGEMFEVSTAYFSDMIDTHGEYRGREYHGVYTHLRPDHLALLPGEVGACSIADGCGCPRLNHQEAAMNVNEDGTITRDDEPVTDDEHLDEESRSLLRSFRDWLTGRRPAGDDGGQPAVKVNAQKVVDGARALVSRALEGLRVNVSARQIMQQLEEAVNQRFRQNPMQNIYVEDLLLDEQAAVVRMDRYGGPLDEDPWKFLRVPYTVTGDTVVLGEGAEEVVPVTEYRPVSQDTDDEPVTQSTKRGGDQPGAFNNGSNQEVDMNREAVIKGLIAHTKAPFDQDDQEYLEALTDEKLKTFAESYECDCQTGEPAPVTHQRGGEDEPAAAVKANTAEEFIDQAPGEMRDVLREGLRLHRERREQLIKGITAHEANPYSDDELRAMTNDQLEKVSKLARANAPADYSGRGGPRNDVRVNADEDDVAPAPLKVSDRLTANQRAAS